MEPANLPQTIVVGLVWPCVRSTTYTHLLLQLPTLPTYLPAYMYIHVSLHSRKHAIIFPAHPAKRETRILTRIGNITLPEFMALRALALRGVVSRAHTASRTPLLATLAHGSRHFANRPRFLQQQGDRSGPDRHTHAPLTNYEHIITPDHHVQWLVRLKKGLDRKACERIAGYIEDHINRRKVSNANILIPRFTRLTSKIGLFLWVLVSKGNHLSLN